MLFRYVFVDFKNYMLFFIHFTEHIFVFFYCMCFDFMLY